MGAVNVIVTCADLYVDGRKHAGPFRSGQTYAFPAP